MIGYASPLHVPIYFAFYVCSYLLTTVLRVNLYGICVRVSLSSAFLLCLPACVLTLCLCVKVTCRGLFHPTRSHRKERGSGQLIYYREKKICQGKQDCEHHAWWRCSPGGNSPHAYHGAALSCISFLLSHNFSLLLSFSLFSSLQLLPCSLRQYTHLIHSSSSSYLCFLHYTYLY